MNSIITQAFLSELDKVAVVGKPLGRQIPKSHGPVRDAQANILKRIPRGSRRRVAASRERAVTALAQLGAPKDIADIGGDLLAKKQRKREVKRSKGVIGKTKTWLKTLRS